MAVKNPSYMQDNQSNKNPYNINYKGTFRVIGLAVFQ